MRRQQPVDLTGKEAFETPQDLALSLALTGPFLGVGLDHRIPSQTTQGNAEQRAVRLKVHATVEAMPRSIPGTGRNRASPAKCGKSSLRGQALRVVTDRNQERSGWILPG